MGFDADIYTKNNKKGAWLCYLYYDFCQFIKPNFTNGKTDGKFDVTRGYLQSKYDELCNAKYTFDDILSKEAIEEQFEFAKQIKEILDKSREYNKYIIEWDM